MSNDANCVLLQSLLLGLQGVHKWPIIYPGTRGADFKDDNNIITVDWIQVAQGRPWEHVPRRLLLFHHSQHSFTLRMH